MPPNPPACRESALTQYYVRPSRRDSHPAAPTAPTASRYGLFHERQLPNSRRIAPNQDDHHLRLPGSAPCRPPRGRSIDRQCRESGRAGGHRRACEPEPEARFLCRAGGSAYRVAPGGCGEQTVGGRGERPSTASDRVSSRHTERLSRRPVAADRLDCARRRLHRRRRLGDFSRCTGAEGGHSRRAGRGRRNPLLRRKCGQREHGASAREPGLTRW